MISVCMIVRNAADDLDVSLGSIREIAGEIIVTDTGSTDDSVMIARRHGARVEDFPWCDDFSAARNHALARAKGDWVLWLDSDEALETASIPGLLRAVERIDVDGFHVIRADLADADDPTRQTRMLQLRLFRRASAVFLGRCHPHFSPPLARVEIAENVVLRHWGYLPERLPEKQRRGARLLALELRDRPGQLYYQIELLRTYLLLGDSRAAEILEQAAGRLAEYRRDVSPPLPHAALLLETLLQWPPEGLPAGWTPADFGSAGHPVVSGFAALAMAGGGSRFPIGRVCSRGKETTPLARARSRAWL